MADDLIKTASFYFNSSLREQAEGGQCCRNECGKCPPVTLGEDMGGNVMELADGSTALHFFSLGKGMWLRSFTMP